MARFKARELRDGTSLEEIRRTLNEIQKELAVDLGTALSRARVTELIIDGPYAARYGDVVRVAPPLLGLRVMLPPKNLEQPGARVVVVVEGTTGALSVEAVDATVNGADTVTYLAGLGTVEFQLTPTGWYGWSASLNTVPLTSLASQAADTFVGRLAGAGSPTAQLLADVDSTSLVYDATSHTFQRAALTGEATAAQNVNALVVTRSTDFQASPWTGPHQFNGEIRGGTITSTSASGAVNITLDAGSTRLLFTSASTITLGTISGAADGRLLFVEHSGAGALVVTHDAASANAVACPGDEDLVLKGRGGVVLVARLGTNANWKVFEHQIDPANLLPFTASRGVLLAIRVAATAGTPGSADDVTIYSANAPFAFRILDVIWLDATAIALSSVQLRDTSGGGGSALSSVLTAAVTGTARNNDTATRTVAAASSVFLRRSDRGVAGEIIIIAVRT